MRRADELLSEWEQLTSADTTADTTADTAADTGAGDVAPGAAERRRYNTLMHRYRNVVADISKLVTVATESIQKRDSLVVSCLATVDHTVCLPCRNR